VAGNGIGVLQVLIDCFGTARKERFKHGTVKIESMGKTRSTRAKGNNECPNTLSVGKYSATVIPLVIILSLIIFMAFFFIGERVGFLPYLTFSNLGNTSFTPSEGILLTIVFLGISIFLAMLIGYIIQRAGIAKRKKK